MKILFVYPPSAYLNHSMFKHFTYFAETIDLVSREFPNVHVLDCAVEMKSRDEIYRAFTDCDALVMLIEPYNIHMTLSLAKICKDVKPKVKTILYGTAAVLVPNYLAQYEEVDHVIANGGFQEGILGILRGEEHSRIVRPELVSGQHVWGCALNAPVPIERYQYFGNRMFEFTVQVGCPFSCSFCSEKLLFPPCRNFLFEQRPVEDVISVLKRAKGSFDSVYFSATTFTYDREWITSICENMVKQDCILPWRSDTRVDCLDPELLQVMKKAGLKQLSLGVESFSNRLLNSVNKRQNADNVYEKIRMCQEYGVSVKALLILGLPGQTAEDVLQTQEVIEELGIPYRWKEYSPIRELYLKDHRNENVSEDIAEFNRTHFKSGDIPGLSPEKYMELLFPKGYIR